MAKNYTFSEAVAIIKKGTDMESIADIGRRYPILAQKVAVVAAKAGDEFVDLMSYMPEYLTANKVNSAIKSEIAGTETEANAETETEVEVSGDATDSKENAISWNESMNAKQLWDILGKAGKRKLAKSTKKADLIEACKKAFGAEIEAEETEEDEIVNPYEGKTAVELFQECKARKIKAVAKKPAKFYVDLLLKDDAAKAEAEAEEVDEEDDWEEEEETSKKVEKKSTSKSNKKPAKKVEVESDDDDDDWDI